MQYHDISSTRSSTRVHQAPGGKSSISFGNYDSQPQQQKKNLPQRSMNHKENTAPQEQQQPQMSSSSSSSSRQTFGMHSKQQRNDRDIMNVPSTRVLAAPGGNSNMGNLIFGGGYEKPSVSTQSAPKQTRNNVQSTKSVDPYMQQQRVPMQQKQQYQPPQQQQQQATNSNIEAMSQQQPAKSSTKVSQPPGGYSQGLW